MILPLSDRNEKNSLNLILKKIFFFYNKFNYKKNDIYFTYKNIFIK